MKNKKYLELKEKINNADTPQDLRRYETELYSALANSEVTDEEADELYEILENELQYWEDLYITTPMHLGDEINFEEVKKLIDIDNYVIGQRGYWFAKPKGEIELFNKAFVSPDQGKHWYPMHLETKTGAPSGRTQTGKFIFRGKPKGENVSIGRNVLTWYANHNEHQVDYNYEIDHINGQYTDDRLENLEKVTKEENAKRRNERIKLMAKDSKIKDLLPLNEYKEFDITVAKYFPEINDIGNDNLLKGSIKSYEEAKKIAENYKGNKNDEICIWGIDSENNRRSYKNLVWYKIVGGNTYDYEKIKSHFIDSNPEKEFIGYDVTYAKHNEKFNGPEYDISILIHPLSTLEEAKIEAEYEWKQNKGYVSIWGITNHNNKRLLWYKTNDGTEYDIKDLEERIDDSHVIHDIIKETSEGYVIYSHKGKRLSKPYKTKKEAEERLKEIEMFKHMNDVLERPELYGKKVKITVNNALSNMIDRMYGKDIISKEVIAKNIINYILPYDGRFDYLNRRFHKKYEILDSQYKGYDIEWKGDYYQVWKDTPEGDTKLGGDFPTYEDAEEFIDNLDSKKEINKPKFKKYEVEFLRFGNNPMTDIILAKDENSAIRILKANWAGEKISDIRIREIKDSKKGIRDMDEVKEWLTKYIVKKDDPNNKLGKTYIRNLKKEEDLPEGVWHKAATDRSGILHFKGMDFYWYLDNMDELHVEKYIRDAKGGRFICESYFDEKLRGLEDREQVDSVEEIQDWILDKANKGYFARAIDRATGEVWMFDPDDLVDDPFELDTIKPSSDDSIEMWIVEWYNPRGIKFKGEFDDEEDAKQFVEENTDDNHLNIQIKQETRSMIDSVKFNKDKIEAELKKILTDYLLKIGYDKDDIDEWLVIECKPFTNDYGDKGINVEIRNEFVGYYDLPDEVINKLDAVVDPGYFEPYYDTVWDAYIFDKTLEDSIEEGKYIYQFPADLTKEDLEEMQNYNLEVLGIVETEGLEEMVEDWLVRGSLEDVKRYCEEYLNYEMHPGYLWKEEDCPYE